MSEENNSFFINDENEINSPNYNNNEDESFAIMNYDKINPIIKNKKEPFDFLGSTAMKSNNFKKMENNEDQNIFKNINEKENDWNFEFEKQLRLELKSSSEPNSIKKEFTEQKDILAIENDNSEKKPVKITKKKRGRKKQKCKNFNEEETHNKCSEDNIIIKIIVKVLNIAIKIINKKIEQTKEGGLLYKINLKPIKQNKAAIYQNLINSKLKDILSKDIVSKYTRHNPYYNKILIEKLYNIQEFKIIFDLTFLQVLKYLRGEEDYEVLRTLNKDNLSLKLEEGNEDEEENNIYNEKYSEVLREFEKKINAKKTRNRKK